MYARKENNEYKRYNKLPKEIRIEAEDKWVQITEDNCAKYGFKDLVHPNYNPRTHKRTTEIVESGSKCTYKVESLNKTLANLKKELLLELRGYRQEAFNEGKHHHDYLKDTGRNSELNSLKTKIGEFYQLHETERAKVEALTTIDDAAEHELDMTAINSALTYLKELT